MRLRGYNKPGVRPKSYYTVKRTLDEFCAGDVGKFDPPFYTSKTIALKTGLDASVVAGQLAILANEPEYEYHQGKSGARLIRRRQSTTPHR